jgi:SPX domain protein involved in polyphosphate accumulation
MIDKLQKQRFELKYRISEAKAQQIRFFVQNYLDCDSYGKTQPNFSYPVHSLYLDSKFLKTYQDTINGNRNRYKLRIRYYDYEETPVFFEIKRRHNKVIRKKRAQVHRRFVLDLMNGQVPTYDHLVYNDAGHYHALQEFCYLQNQLQAQPVLHVSYLREAYELEHSNAVRVTFDRDVRSNLQTDFELLSKPENSLSTFGDTVVLELKFTDRFPQWLQELTQLFHLRQESAAKYVDSIEKLEFRKYELA